MIALCLALLAAPAQADLAPPEITGPSGLSGPHPVITGRSPSPVLTITLYVDGAAAGSAKSTPSHGGRSGVWSLTPTAPLTDGPVISGGARSAWAGAARRARQSAIMEVPRS